MCILCNSRWPLYQQTKLRTFANQKWITTTEWNNTEQSTIQTTKYKEQVKLGIFLVGCIFPQVFSPRQLSFRAVRVVCLWSVVIPLLFFWGVFSCFSFDLCKYCFTSVASYHCCYLFCCCQLSIVLLQVQCIHFLYCKQAITSEINSITFLLNVCQR